MKLTENRMGFFSKIGQEVMEFADKYCLAKHDISGGMYITDFSPFDISFIVEWETGCMGCYDQHNFSFSIPHKAFCDDNWREALQKEIDAAREKEKEQQRIRTEAELRRREQSELQEYIRLQKKFGQ